MTVQRTARRAGVAVGGGVLLGAGSAMLVLPGPGLFVMLGGLALLGTEYDWARRPLDSMRARLDRSVSR